MGAERALTVVAVVFLVAGIGLLGWSVAPSVPGVDAAETVLDRDLTGPAKVFEPTKPFARLDTAGGTYELRVTSTANFVIGERRADRPDDAIAERDSNAYNAGGDTQYYYGTEFRSTIRSDAPNAPDAGPKVFFIKFPGATTSSAFHATATYTPTAAAPLIVLKAWASLVGLIVGAVGLVLFLLRAALPTRRAESDDPPTPPGE